MDMKTGTLLIALVAGLIANPVLARELEGMYVADTVTLTGTKSRLVLNGVGLHAKYLTKLYVAALYLPQFTTDAGAILQQTGPKRITLFIAQDKFSKEQWTEMWLDGFRGNRTEKEFTVIKPQVQQFISYFDPVVKNDAVILEYQPKTGTSVYINGKLKGAMPGKEFQLELLNIWLGEDPIDKALKQALLGAE